MEKQISAVHSRLFIILWLVMNIPNCVNSQIIPSSHDPKIGVRIIREIGVDTICYAGISSLGDVPAFCQNDSFFMVCSSINMVYSVSYLLEVYSKKEPCKFISSYNYTESNRLIWRKTRIYASDNKIFIEFNDCGRVINLLEFDPYKMSLKDARKQILEGLRKI